ncbi:ubiquitin-like small modifier protein 1 [Aminiphilus sp.]|jgi:MoaD family protein|uniref:ubiquitin-like small modifier protein 1 n=1 Tax=Aminiphilus sp. TaxID=1872488 RepID=UPI002606373F|nr:ubiquitin-like small modifier protein 1 [Aminiphilus sp.]
MEVLFFATIRNLTGEKELRVPRAATVRALLELLATRYGERFRRKVLDENGDPSPELIVLVNGHHIAHLDGGDTPLAETDRISLFPVIGGG